MEPEFPPDDGLSGEPFNISRARVSGVGGLAVVAMALALAVSVPRVGVTLSIGGLSGLVLGIGLILRRRRSGAMPSSGRRPGANTTLSIDRREP